MLVAGGAAAQEQSIIVQSTTSTANSGLYDYLLPIFKDKTGIQVNVVAVGTGQAIKNAENCDGDVLLVHARPAEEKFVAAGFGTERTDLMYNDFVIVGPASDPAGVGGMDGVQGALATIAETARCLPRVAMTAALTRRKWRFGPTAASIRRRPRASGIAKPGPAWAPR